jgi:protein-tyrosine phosphatase
VEVADQILDASRSRKTVVIHCRQGIGRSPAMVAAALIAGNLNSETAVNVVRESRGLDVPETQAQRQWIWDFSAWLSSRRAAQQQHAAGGGSRRR